jgi:hypothetical protein
MHPEVQLQALIDTRDEFDDEFDYDRWKAISTGGGRHISSGGGTRTHNLRINSPPLCQLSYPGTTYGVYQRASTLLCRARFR